MLEVALVVVVGGADERAPEPRQREDRAAAAGGHDRPRAQRQVRLREDQVGAPARADLRHLRLVVELLGAQPVRPHAGRVDDVARAHDERLAAARVAREHAGGAAALEPQLLDGEVVGADRAEALGLAEHGQHEPHVVGLAVVEEVAGTRLARRERRQQLEHLLAGDRAVAVGAPGLGGAAAAAAALDRHHVVEVEAHPDEAVEPRAVEGGDDDRQRADQMRRERDEQLALEQRLAHQPEVEVLEVAQAAVDELARAAGGAGGVVGALEQRHAVAAAGGVEGDAGPGDAAADDGDVEALTGERVEGLGARDHQPQSRRRPGVPG